MKRRHIVAIGVGVLVAAMVVLGLSTVLLAQAAPGDVGSPECRVVQKDAQTAVDSGGPYNNLGKLVSTAAKVVSPNVADLTITEECSSCIMNQFARRIPIGEQVACGPDIPVNPECASEVCGTYTPCNEGGNCGSTGVCVSVYEGGGTCLDGATPCGGLTRCPTGTGECAVGEVCGVNTCCVDNVCVPPDAFCWPGP